MSDRVSVTLTILTAQAEAAARYINAYDYWNTPRGTTSYQFDKVEMGELPFLHKLIAEGIAYNSTWEEGDEFHKGTEYLRFTADGEAIHKEVYITDTNPSTKELLKYIDDPKALRAYILDHAERVTPLPFDAQQIINGKVYLTRKLLEPA